MGKKNRAQKRQEEDEAEEQRLQMICGKPPALETPAAEDTVDLAGNKADEKNMEKESSAKFTAETQLPGEAENIEEAGEVMGVDEIVDEGDDEERLEVDETVDEGDDEERQETKDLSTEDQLVIKGWFGKLMLHSRTKSCSNAPLSMLWAILFWVMNMLACEATRMLVDDVWAAVAIRCKEEERAFKKAKRVAAEKLQREVLEREEATAEAEYQCAVNQANEKKDSALYCPVSKRWFPMVKLMEGVPDSIRAKGSNWERWQKNLSMKVKSGRGGGKWVRAKVGDGWASAPSRLDVKDSMVKMDEIHFFTCVSRDSETFVLDVTSWISSHLMTASQAKELELLDKFRPIFSCTDSELGFQAALLPGVVKEQEMEDGSVIVKKPVKKEKKTRAEKRAKKASYGGARR